jgi:gliding motility-associated-like protein
MKLKWMFVFLFLISSVQAWAQKVFFSGNDFNSVFICEDGRVFASGENSLGQLGNGTFISSNSPLLLAGIDGVGTLPTCKQVQIEGVSCNLALTNSGDTVLAWGANDFGQIGDGTIINKPFPVRVKGVGGVGYLQNIKQIVTGNYSSYALTEDQKVLNWGGNQFGQLGNGTFSTSVVYPDYVLKAPGDTLKNIRYISAGGIFCMALLCDGTVWAWGSNGGGELAQNNTTNSAYAVQVKNSLGTGYLSNIKKIEAGDNYAFALSNTDTLWCWGTNNAGELGIGSTVPNRFILPTYTRNFSGTGQLAGVIEIAAGQGHAAAILSDNTVAAWGLNASGQLGINTTLSSNLPVQVMEMNGVNPLSDINYISTGDFFSIARTSTNQLYVWGENGSGQLGLGDTNDRHLPSLLLLPCPPTSDIFPGDGRMVHPSLVCSGINNGNVYINKYHSSIIGWEYSTDNFLSFDTIQENNFSVAFTNITQPVSYRVILSECGIQSYSPVALISVDPLTQPGSLQSSATVRKYYNGDKLNLTGYVGAVVHWEWSENNFVYDWHSFNSTSDTQRYSGLTKTTYYRVLIKSGVCDGMYSNAVEIKTIDSKDVKIYDSFTPNGDHYNDDWIIDLIELFPDNRVEIYNRWGQLVYKTEHYDNVNRVWRGESNVAGSGGTTLADDTFFYMVDLGGNYSIQKGYVVISR